MSSRGRRSREPRNNKYNRRVDNGENNSGQGSSCATAESDISLSLLSGDRLQDELRRSSVEDAGALTVDRSEFPSLPPPARAACLKTNGAAGGLLPDDEDADLLRAMEESLRIAPSSSTDDPALKRAVEESKAELIIQQKRMLSEFEMQRVKSEYQIKKPSEVSGDVTDAYAAIVRQSPCTHEDVKESQTKYKKAKGKRRPTILDTAEVLGFFSDYGESSSQSSFNTREPSRSSRRGNSSSAGRASFSYANSNDFTSSGIRHSGRSQFCTPIVGSEAGPSGQLKSKVTADGLRYGKESMPKELTRSPQDSQYMLSRPRSFREVSVILDAENIGRQYGHGIWSARGVDIAINHYRHGGHEVLATLPAHLERCASKECRCILDRIRETDSKILWSNPSPICYRADVLEHAVNVAENSAVVIVSNDNFANELASLQNQEVAERSRKFLRKYRLSFTWEGERFIPQDFPE